MTAEVERILCAAVWVDTGKAEPPRRSYAYPKTGLMFCGWRHGDCLCGVGAWWRLVDDVERERIEGINGEGTPWNRQGFLTSTGRFVDRDEGAQIAVAAGQTGANGRSVETNHLFSEDLY